MSDSLTPLPKHMPKVREAREALKARALEIQDLYIEAAKKAFAMDKPEEAMKGLQWLIEHMPSEEGTTMIDSSVDTKKIADSTPKGPHIQIGIALGNPAKPKEQILGTKIEVIDIPQDEDESDS